MIDLTYWILFSVSLLTIYIYYKEKSFSGINFFSILIIIFIVYCIISSFLIRVGLFNGFYFLIPIQNNVNVIQIGSILQIWSMLGILLSIYILDKYFQTNVIYFSIFGFKNSFFLEHKRLVSFLFIFFIIFSITYAYQSYPAIPELLSSGASQITIAERRLQLTRDYTGNGYIKTISIDLSLIVIFLLGIMIQQRKKNLISFFPILILTLITCLSTGEKSFFVLWFIYFYFGFSFFKKSTINIWLIIFITILAIFAYLVQFGLSVESMRNFFERIFLAQGVAVYLSVDQYLNGNNLIYFNSMPSPLTSFLISDSGPTRAASDAYVDIYYPGMRELGTWNVNGLYIHEALANFGLSIAIISPLIIGSLMYFILLFIKSNKNNFSSLLFYIFFVLNFTPFITSYNRLIFNTETIMMFIVLISIELLSMLSTKGRFSHKINFLFQGDKK